MINKASLSKIIKLALLPLVLVFGALAVQANGGSDSADIKAVMDKQLVAWNNGDIDGFMAGYWKSDKLKFVSKNGITYGWQKVYDNYKKSYPDKATMGTLAFEIISIESLADDNFHSVGAPAGKNKSYMVVGKWMISGSVKAAQGYYTLLFKKINGQWVIVSDHTS